jgi:hypothetical protein
MSLVTRSGEQWTLLQAAFWSYPAEMDLSFLQLIKQQGSLGRRGGDPKQ